jgi:two-component system NtrC family sensor kinase
MFNSIWKKFTVALLVTTFTPIGYFLHSDLSAARGMIVEEKLKVIYLNAITRAKDIERTFFNAHKDMNYLRSSLAMQFLLEIPSSKSDAAIYWRSLVERELDLFLSMRPECESVGLIDEYGDETVVLFKNGGRIISLSDNQKRNRLTAPFYVDTASLEKFGVAAIQMRNSVEAGRDMGSVTLIRYATKVFDKSGKPRFVVYMDMNGSDLAMWLSRTSHERRRRAALITNEGNYIYNPYAEVSDAVPPVPAALNIKEEFPTQVVHQLLSGRRGVISDDDNNLFSYISLHPQIGNSDFYYVVFDKFPRDLIFPRLEAIKETYIKGAVAALILCLALSALLSWALTRNIAKLREGVERLGRRKLDFRLDIKSGDEIESLAEDYNSMADSLQEYSQTLERKVEDRTARVKEVERQLASAEKLAAIGYLAAGVAHEINNPISVIVTRLELIRRELKKGKTDEVVLKDLDAISRHAERISKIAGGLLAFARDGGRKIESVDLNKAVERVMALLDGQIRNNGVEARLELDPAIGLALANSMGVEQVVYNLVHNACQAACAGGSITVSTFNMEDGRVALRVCDTGPGIPEENIGRVFEPFFTTKDPGQGTGLGLSISYGLVKDFGGSITVESSPGKGAAFTVKLKAALCPPDKGGGQRPGG